MKLSYRLKRVCGNVFNNGNIIFTPDGNSILSPVGNRVTFFDLVEQSSTTLPFESKKNIRRCAISHSGRFLITVDVDGHALFINFPRRVVLQRFHFKRKVYDIKFAPNDEHFAVTFGNGCQIWRTPSVEREFCPLTLSRVISGHNDAVVCLDWSSDSESIIMGSKDLSARVYYRVHSKNMAMTSLSGHRDKLVGVFFDKTGDSAYTVARDGAVFTWSFEYAERLPQFSNAAKKQRKGKADDSDEDDNDSDGSSSSSGESDSEVDNQTTVRGGSWRLKSREFLWEPHTEVTSVAFNKASSLLVVGFDKGAFGLFEMPSCTCIHRLSVSHQSLNTAALNASGEWLALGSSRLGQLLVWEWQSETYVLKQQGHLYGLNVVDYSTDGQYIGTGGEDGKMKIWNALSGFCNVTFTDHLAPITGVKFAGRGAARAVLSCSLDGSVRAYDLLRYRNFKTMTTSTPVQFSCLAVDPSGDIVCAGAMDPFQVYVWALQTGRLLEVLSGHEGPLASLDFSPSGAQLASGSWDGTMKVWDVYNNSCVDTMEHGCDVLSVSFRSDGKELCTAATNGNLYFWDVETGAQLATIEGRRDISGGRLSTDARTAGNSSRSKHFTTVTYSPDGHFVLAGGHSKYTCVYNTASCTLVKKFQLSHNRSLDGVLDQLRSDHLVDGVSLDNLAAGTQSDSEDEVRAPSLLPGANGVGGRSAGDGSRTIRPEILTAAVRFSPTGREWAAATTQGLQVFSLDDAMLFAPTNLDTTATPQAVQAAIMHQEYGKAISMALQLSLSETATLKSAVDAVPTVSIDLVVKSLDVRMLREMFRFLAVELATSRHLEFYLRWCWELLRHFGPVLSRDLSQSMAYREGLRSLLRAISQHEREAMTMGEENQFMLQFLNTELQRHPAEDSNSDLVEKADENNNNKEVKKRSVTDLVDESVGATDVEDFEDNESKRNLVAASVSSAKASVLNQVVSSKGGSEDNDGNIIASEKGSTTKKKRKQRAVRT